MVCSLTISRKKPFSVDSALILQLKFLQNSITKEGYAHVICVGADILK